MTVELMLEAAAAAGLDVTVAPVNCLGPCAFGPNVVCGWSVPGSGVRASQPQLVRAEIHRENRDPKIQPGIYDGVKTLADCEEVLAAFEASGGISRAQAAG